MIMKMESFYFNPSRNLGKEKKTPQVNYILIYKLIFYMGSINLILIKFNIQIHVPDYYMINKKKSS